MKFDVTVLIEPHNAVTSANDSLKRCFRSKFVLYTRRILSRSITGHFNYVADLESFLDHFPPAHGGRVYDTPMPEQEAQNRKHGFFSKQWSRRSILLGLGFHFSLWWALSVWLSRATWNWTR